MKKLILILAILACGCNTNFVKVERHIYITESTEVHVEDTEQGGSELKDAIKGNKQKADGKIADEIKGK